MPIKINNSQTRLYNWLPACHLAVVVTVLFLILFANTAYAYIAREYPAEETFTAGTLVALTDEGAIRPASIMQTNYIGVAVAQNEDSVEISSSGATQVLVSDLEGEIAIGDQIALSRAPGVGVVESSKGNVIGTALETFDSNAADWQQLEIMMSDGTNQTVNTGRIEVRLSGQVSNYMSGDTILTSLQTVAEQMTGQTLPVWRVLLALAVGFGGLLMSSILLFSSVRGSFFSLGRNPLAGDTIIHSLWHVVRVALLILASGLILAYLVVGI